MELSDTPKVEKLTVDHLQSPLIILAVGLLIATIIWIGEICKAKIHLSEVKKRNNRRRTNRIRRTNRRRNNRGLEVALERIDATLE